MKFKFKSTAILSLIAVIVYYGIGYFFDCFVFEAKIKIDILILLLVFIQDKIIDFTIKKALKNSCRLQVIKKQVYFLFKNKKANFDKYYNKAMLLKKYKLAHFIEAIAESVLTSPIGQEEIVLKIDNKEIKEIYTNRSFKWKREIKRKIKDYYLFFSNSEDIYFECETKDIIKKQNDVSILEYSLIWLSYVVLISQILGLNELGVEKVNYIRSFIFLNILDIGKHMDVYRILLRLEIKKYKDFYDAIIEMEKMVLNPNNTIYIEFNGEKFPYLYKTQGDKTISKPH